MSDLSSVITTSGGGQYWRCVQCNMRNTISNFRCMACYFPFKQQIRKTAQFKQREEMRKLREARLSEPQRDDEDHDDEPQGQAADDAGVAGMDAEKKSKDKEKEQAETDAATESQNEEKAPGPAAGRVDTSAEESKTPAKPKGGKVLKRERARVQLASVMPVPATMQVLRKEEEKEGLSLVRETPVPECAEDEVLVKCFSVGICGSDVLLYKWSKEASLIAKVPFVPGHEAAGMVVRVGSAVRRLSIGDRVAIENHFYCGDCELCREGRGDICLNLNQFGHGKGTDQGGCGQYFTAPAKYCYRLESNISWEEAALLEPLGVAHNACRQASVMNAKDLLVIGCGTIGLLAINVAKAMGCRKVYACDVVGSKLELARMMGADTVINVSEEDLYERLMRETEGLGVTRLIECSGSAKAVSDCFRLLRKDAHVVLVGLPKQAIVIEDPMKELVFKSITLRTIHGRRIFQTWRAAERLLATGRVNALKVVTHKLPLSEYATGYSALISGKAIKVLFDPTR